MSYAKGLILIIQDRVNHLSAFLEKYQGEDRDDVLSEIAAHEAILDILTGIE
jgi:hypothetical protein